MNQIEHIKSLPAWEWMPKSEHEMLLTGQGIIDQTTIMWAIGNVAVVGFIYESMVNPPCMWFALAKKVTFSDLIDFRRLALEIPMDTITAVEADFAVGLRFAKFYGFVETGEEQEHNGLNYKILRRA